MNANPLGQLSSIFEKLTDPRDPRGVRFSFSALCSLAFPGLLARINEMAVLVRWTKAHWEQLREPPSVSCISHSLSKLSLTEFRQVFAEWIRSQLEHEDAILAVFPLLNLLTGDAIFLQRPLLEVLQDKSCEYLFQLKANQPEIREALKICFSEDRIGTPAAETVDKKGRNRSRTFCRKTAYLSMPRRGSQSLERFRNCSGVK